MKSLLSAALAVVLAAASALAGVTFRVTVEPSLSTQPVSGRLIVSVIGAGSKVGPKDDPNNAPFWEDPDQPMFGLEVRGLAGDHAVVLDDGADTRTIKPSQLPPGEYRAAARVITTRLSSNWRNDPGNLYSGTVTFTIPKPAPGKEDSPLSPQEVEIRLNAVTKAREWPKAYTEAGAELFEVRSKLLSEFHHREVVLRAGVVRPIDFDPEVKYAAIYEVPGFGGDHFGAVGPASRRREMASAETRSKKPDAELMLAQSTFHIVLDPESPNGHTLFADSANNGPCGRALVEELIPALEAKYALIAKPEARLLRGHSSGGWSTLWLAINYPQVFGATWSSSPDPVNFRRLEVVYIYRQLSAYTNSWPKDDEIMGIGMRGPPQAFVPPLRAGMNEEIVSSRGGGKPGMTIRQESGNEDILGPDNTSGQQWDSWFAVWGPRNANGHPAALFDPKTGEIDHAIAEQYRKYDISDLLRKQPEKYGPIFQNRVRLVVGDWDNFFLNEAVALLKQEVDKLPKPAGEYKPVGYIRIVPNLDHGSIFQSAEIRAFPGQMLEHLKAHDAMPRAAESGSK